MPTPDPLPTADIPPPAGPDGPTLAPRPPDDPGTDTRPPSGTAPPPADGSFPAIPGYAVEAEVARGGMGVVYRARHLRLNRPVAVKVVLGGRFQDPLTRVRFLVEGEALARVRHPHVVPVYELGQAGDLPFLAMEYVGGGTLADALARAGRFAPRVAAELAAQLADGVAGAHAQGVVHRDLKPANVLLTEDGQPKITDFGLAKVGGSGMTVTGAVLGTPSYMAPEQAAGKVHEVGTAADVYGLGAVLYELLTGRPPFKAGSTLETIQHVLGREAARPKSIVADLPRDLETICLKCLQKDPARRYPTAAALADDLRAYLDGRPIAARPVGAAERAVKWARRHPGRTAALAAGLLLAVGAGFIAVEVRRQREADLRAARADSLVESLASADTAGVLRVVADLGEVRDLARPGLADLAAGPIAAKPGLHARMALLPDEPGRAAELAAYLPDARPEELLAVRPLLTPHAGAVAPPLWAVLTDDRADPAKRVRAAGALAGLTPADPRWPAVGPAVAAGAVRATPAEFVAWADALEPVRVHLLPGLLDRYAEARRRIEAGKLAVSDLAAEATALDLAANLLARYAADRPADLARLAVAVEARHHALIAAALAANRAAVVPLLVAEVEAGDPGVVRDDVPFDAAFAAAAGAALERGGADPGRGVRRPGQAAGERGGRGADPGRVRPGLAGAEAHPGPERPELPGRPAGRDRGRPEGPGAAVRRRAGRVGEAGGGDRPRRLPGRPDPGGGAGAVRGPAVGAVPGAPGPGAARGDRLAVAAAVGAVGGRGRDRRRADGRGQAAGGVGPVGVGLAGGGRAGDGGGGPGVDR